jgi:hypothetical protein
MGGYALYVKHIFCFKAQIVLTIDSIGAKLLIREDKQEGIACQRLAKNCPG